jgi:uncharacterized membrane protein
MVNRFAKYFFQGLLLIAPVSLTLYVIWACIQWVDALVYNVLGTFMEVPLVVPGVGLIVFVLMITLLGYIGSTFIARALFDMLENVLNRLPLVKIIYSSLKDLLSAFVGDKKKFDQAVLVTINREANLQKLGFITQNDMASLGIAERIAVYVPHSYNFSGDLFIVPVSSITPVNMAGSDIMKFIVSGGVAGVGADPVLTVASDQQTL